MRINVWMPQMQQKCFSILSGSQFRLLPAEIQSKGAEVARLREGFHHGSLPQELCQSPHAIPAVHKAVPSLLGHVCTCPCQC